MLTQKGFDKVFKIIATSAFPSPESDFALSVFSASFEPPPHDTNKNNPKSIKMLFKNLFIFFPPKIFLLY